MQLEEDEMKVYEYQKCILKGDMKILLSYEGNNRRALPHVERENVDSQTKKYGGAGDRQAGGIDDVDKKKWHCGNIQIAQEEGNILIKLDMLDYNSYVEDRHSYETLEEGDKKVEEGNTLIFPQRIIRSAEGNEDSHDGETIIKGKRTIFFS